MFGFITSWLTPTSLFLILNLMIGTIVIMSRYHKNPQHDHQLGPDNSHQLVRVPSLLDRVKSINFSVYKFPSSNLDTNFHYTEPEHHTNPVDPFPPPLTRVPSLLERVKSINFSSFYSSDSQNPEPEVHTNPVDPFPPPLTRAPSLLERVKSINFSSFYSSDSQNPEPEVHTNPVDPFPPPLTRAPSLLERVKSINFSSFYSSDSQNPEPKVHTEPQLDSDPGQDHDHDHAHDHHVKRTKSDTKPGPEIVPEKMKKSASEKSERRIEKTGSFGEAGDHGVDAKADDFINRFKQQLRLQRLDSLLRYRG